MARFIYGVLVNNDHVKNAEESSDNNDKTGKVYKMILEYARKNGLNVEEIHGGGFIDERYSYMIVAIDGSETFIGSKVVQKVGEFSINKKSTWDEKLKAVVDFLNHDILENPELYKLIIDKCDEDGEYDEYDLKHPDLIKFDPGWFFVND